MRRLLPLLVALAVAACSRAPDDEGRRRLFSADGAARPASGPFDFSRPADALALDADEVAGRLGSFEWNAGVEWSVSREGEDGARVRAVERHRLTQAATGEFEVSADVDPGLGPGSETGREVVSAGGMTYARARHAPWRERPTDRGRDARRFRAESFSLPLSVARLFGDGLVVEPKGETRVLGRPARRFSLSLAPGAKPVPSPARPPGAPELDDDTRARLRFLEGRVPTSAAGELVLDAATGAPLRVRLSGAFSVTGAPDVRTSVELSAQIRAVGAEVKAVAAPKGALPDERKAAGVAGALDAAGLRRRGEPEPARAEPADEPE